MPLTPPVQEDATLNKAMSKAMSRTSCSSCSYVMMLVALANAAEKDAASPLPKHRRMLIFGPPGVGKGTQSRRIVETYGICHISTGDMLRAEANAQKPTPLGKRAKQLMKAGTLLPDQLMIRMVQRRLRKERACRKYGWLLDGFPRTAGQAHAMVAGGLVPQHIVVLNANSTTLLERVAARAKAAVARGETPRSDDTAATMMRRLVEYEKNRDATLAAFRSYLQFANISSGGSVEGTAGLIAAALPSA